VNKEQLNAIRARCEAATPGPWGLVRGTDNLIIANADTEYVPADVICSIFRGLTPCSIHPFTDKLSVNAEFIANARQDIPALLDYIAELEAKLEDPLTYQGAINSREIPWESMGR